MVENSKNYLFFITYNQIKLKIKSSYNINNLSIDLKRSISFKFCKHLLLVEIIMI